MHVVKFVQRDLTRQYCKYLIASSFAQQPSTTAFVLYGAYVEGEMATSEIFHIIVCDTSILYLLMRGCC